jgi:hypothetical protein
MSDPSRLTTPQQFPTRQAAAIEGRSRRGAVTGKLKTALDLMVWDYLKRKEAAALAGLADSSLRFAFRKAHVMSYYRAELAALRENLRARNIHRLDTIADDSKNDMARVAAVKALEIITDQAEERRPAGGDVKLPGLQIVIINGPDTPPKVIGPAPTSLAQTQRALIDHQPA